MELGFMLYFLVVFVGGGLLLLVVILYFLLELFNCRDRPRWSARSRFSKVIFLSFAALGAVLLFIPLRMIWATQVWSIPGQYKADGAWGNATLDMLKDGTFVETWHFRNEYNHEPEGDGTIRGRWRDAGRDGLTRDILLSPFIPLAEVQRGESYKEVSVTVSAYVGFTSIEVDHGADIAFAK